MRTGHVAGVVAMFALALATGSSVAGAMARHSGGAQSDDRLVEQTDDRALGKTPDQATLDAIDDAIAHKDANLARDRIARALATPSLDRDAVIGLLRLRAITFSWGNDTAGLRDSLARLETAAPDDPEQAAFAVGLLGHMISPQLGSEVLSRFITQFPDKIGLLDAGYTSTLVGRIRRGGLAREADDATLFLAEHGFSATSMDIRTAFQRTAAGVAIARGQVDRAIALVADVHDRDALTFLLTDRRFAPLWPALSTRVGPHMRAAEAANIAETKAVLAQSPDDPEAQRSVLDAYFSAGQFDNADAIGVSFGATPEALQSLNEADSWVVVDHAYSLYIRNRQAESDARFASVTNRDVARNFWIINAMITRVDMLVRTGRFTTAAPLLDQVIPLAETSATPAARQFLRRGKICSDRALRPGIDQSDIIAQLEAHGRDAPISTIEGLFCIGEPDKAAALIISMLADPEQQPDAIAWLQPDGVFRLGPPSIWSADWNLLRARPDVHAAFDRVARTLPKDLWPSDASEKPLR